MSDCILFAILFTAGWIIWGATIWCAVRFGVRRHQPWRKR